MPIVLPPPIVSKATGSTEQILIGTATSPPGGVESYFEYNGLLMNDRSLIDTFLITGIDGLHDADVRDMRDVNPSYHGETAFNAWYGGRTIVLSGRIRAHEIKKLRDMQDSLKLAFGSLEELPLKIASNFNNYDVEIYCRKSQPIVMAESQTNFNFNRDFMVTLRASDPRFRSIQPVVSQATKTGSTFNPLSLANIGNSRAQPLIRIVGPIANPTITNVTSGEFMTFNINLLTTQGLEINILERTVVDFTGASKFNTLNVNSDWLELIPGPNSLELTGTGITSGSDFLVDFKHAWL